jgi:hypothetical protein
MAVQDPVIEGRAAPRTEATERPRTPSELQRPAFLVNFPFSYSTEVANNAWMTDIAEEERQPDPRRAMTQFLSLYSFLASDGLVYLLPTPRLEGLQDLVFTANLGIVLEQVDPSPVVVSNFSSEPRRGESEVGLAFFGSMGYDVHFAPHRFEGEADLKHLHDNVYVGGYGLRSERESYEWMEREFDIEIVKVQETDPYLYHLDCTIFPRRSPRSNATRTSTSAWTSATPESATPCVSRTPSSMVRACTTCAPGARTIVTR